MKKVLFSFIMLFSIFCIHAQDTISTSFANNNSASGVSLEVEATSSIMLNGILNAFQSSTATADVWIRWGGVNGIPGDKVTVNAANGWFIYQSGATVGTLVNGLAPLTNFSPLLIPAGTTVGIVLSGSTFYSGSGSTPLTPNSFAGNHAILRAGGPTTGFGGSVPNLANEPRGFVGSIVYELDVAGNCADPFMTVMIDSVGSTSAKVLWTKGSSNSSYWIEYGLAGFTPGSGTKVTGSYPGSATRVWLNNLSILSDYEFYIGEICNSGNDSVYSVSPYAFTTTKLCPEPTNLITSNITASSVNIKWDYTGTAPNFTVYYGLKGSVMGSGGNAVVTSSPYTLSGLSGNTEYDIYVTANCGGTNGISDTVGSVTFLTACGSMTTPFTQTFDNTPTGSSSNPSEPNCWSFEQTSGASGYGYNYGGSTYASGFARGGVGNSFRIYSNTNTASGDSMAFVSPQIANMSTVTKQIEFYSRSRSASSSYDVKFVVGTVAGHNQLNTFVPIDTISVGNNATYQKFTVLFNTASGYNGTHGYVAFFDISDEKDHYLIDDITISDAPNCLPSTNVVISNITNNSADFTWTPGQGTSQQVIYGPVGFLQATSTIHGGLNGSYAISQLLGDDCFELYVRDSCVGGYSPWAGPYQFCTLCDYVSVPVLEGFETTPTGTNTNPSAPDCWNFTRTGAGNGYGFTHNSAGDSKTDSTYFYMHTNDNPASNDLMGLVSPGINGLTNGDKRIELWARSRFPYAIHDINLIVGTVLSPLDMSTFTPIDTINVGNNTTYQHFITDISTANGYNGTHDYIAVLDNSTTGSYAFIDEITIATIPSCAASSNLVVSSISYGSATASWDAGGGVSYQIEYGLTGFTHGGGTSVTGLTSTNYTINSLTGTSCYDVYVRDSCATGLSPWFGPISFCTSCAPLATPVSENFNTTISGSSSNPSPPTCWSYVESQVTAGYGNTSSTTGQPNGAKHFRMYSPTNVTTDTIALITPAIAGITAGNKLISFYAKTSGTNPGTLIIGTSPANSSVKNFTPIDTVTTDGSTYSTKFEVYINSSSGYNGTDQYIVMMHGNSSAQAYVYIDDIEIDDIPSCVVPYSLGVTNISATGATLTWATTGGIDFRVEYGPRGFIQGSGTSANGTVVNNATSPTTIGSLTPNTEYQFYVGDNCDTFNFAGPFLFTTDCLGPISGTYTVGSPTSDFKNLDSAFFVLSECGINGPVTLNLQGGSLATFSMRLGHINGASATNTVSLVGGTVSADTLNYGSSTGIVLELDSSNYVTFKNFTINAPNASRMVWMHSAAEHITFDSINFLGTTTSTSNHYLIVASSSPTSTVSGSGNNVNNFTLQNSNLYGGYLSMIILGEGSSNKNSNFTIENNNFINPYYYGVRMYDVDNVEINSNKINCTGPSSYAILLQEADYLTIEGNETKAGNYGLYINGSNKTGAPVRSTIVNNMFIGGNYGVYFKSTKNVNIYHNSIFGDNRGIHFEANFNNNFDLVNNIITSDLGEAIFASNDPVAAKFDYNVYFTNSSSPFNFGSNTYATLGAWQTAAITENDSSLYGDPMFIASDDLRIVFGIIANDKGDATVGIISDIDQNIRPASGSVRVDIGAYEYSPIITDLSIVDGNFRKGICLTQNDTVEVQVKNLTGSNINLATDSIMVNWDVTGPVASSGTVVANSGNLPLGDTLALLALGVDLSVPGIYLLNAYIEPTSYNAYFLNDTLIQTSIVVNPLWTVTPLALGDTIYTTTDSSDLSVQSPFFGKEVFFITEICQYAGSGTGGPAGGTPSWLLADDYIEITGTPGADLEGITLEQWDGSTMESSYTFPQGTVLGPNGTAIIAVGDLGTSVSSLADFYYHGTGNFTGSFSSGDDAGRILKDASNQIMDAVGYNTAYTFPAAAGVSPNDWSGSAISGSSSWGIRLEGPDLNSPAGWVKNTQDPNIVNNLVSLPIAGSSAGFTWSQVVNGSLVQVDTVPNIKVGANTPGIFFYVALYTNACGTFTDTVTIYSFVTGCPGPTSITSNTSCTEATITWTSDVNTTDSYIEYGVAGFPYGSGTPMPSSSSPQVISGLLPNTAYDFYLVDSCTVAGFSTPVKVADTTQVGFTSATFLWVQSATTISNATVDFDASASVNGTTYTWNFGDGSAAGIGAMPTHQYIANGQYYVTVDAEGPCDTSTFGDTILIERISISEGLPLEQTFDVYPNPSNGKVYVELNFGGMNDVSIRVRNFIGQEVYQLELGSVSNKHTEEFDLENQAVGVYFIEVHSSKGTMVKRIVIQ